MTGHARRVTWTRGRGRLYPAIAAVCLGLQLLQVSAAAQGPPAPVRPTPRVNTATTTIRGSKNPELITDESAIQMLVLAFSSSAARPDRAFEMQTSRLNLSGSDLRILRREMDRAHQALEEARSQAGPPSPTSVPVPQQMRAISLETYGRLLEGLSKGGARSLREHVEYVKTGMTSFGGTGPISELTPLRLLLSRLAETRPEVVFARLKLDAADRALLLSEAQRFKEAMEEARQNLAAARPLEPEKQLASGLDALLALSRESEARANVLLGAALERLGAQLTKDGNAKLQSYLQEVRRNMVQG